MRWDKNVVNAFMEGHFKASTLTSCRKFNSLGEDVSTCKFNKGLGGHTSSVPSLYSNAFMANKANVQKSYSICSPYLSSNIINQSGVGKNSRRIRNNMLIMMPSSSPMVPYEVPGAGYHRYVDIYQRLYYDRILLCGQFIDDRVANQIIAILFFLHQENKEKPIYMYFNIPGAHLKPALSVYDTMMSIGNEIETINLGLTTGMGSFLCGAGTKGRRYALPNSRFLLQKTGFEEVVRGQASDISIEVSDTCKANKRYLEGMNRITGRSIEQLEKDFKRDFYLSAEESVEYGMVDHVIYPGTKDPLMIPDSEIYFSKFVSGSDQKFQGNPRAGFGSGIKDRTNLPRMR